MEIIGHDNYVSQDGCFIFQYDNMPKVLTNLQNVTTLQRSLLATGRLGLVRIPSRLAHQTAPMPALPSPSFEECDHPTPTDTRPPQGSPLTDSLSKESNRLSASYQKQEYIPLRQSKRLTAILVTFGLTHLLPGSAPLQHPSSWHDLMLLPYKENSLATLLISYIYQLLMTGERRDAKEAVSNMTEGEAKFLESRGYSARDLAIWASLIIEPDPLLPGSDTKKMILSHTKTPPDRPIPLFPLFFFLSRERLSTKNITALIPYFRARIHHNQAIFKQQRDCLPRPTDLLHEGAILTLVKRLIRLANQTAVATVPDIIDFFNDHISTTGQMLISSQKRASVKKERIKRTSYRCNEMLTYLAAPSKAFPFASAEYRSAAQFSILAKMASFTPPLTITAEGYEAIVRVQLQRPKADNERDWVAMQSRSWPPWKEDRSGVDADKDYEYGLARSAKVINRMLEAGYAPRDWTDLAMMYSGWDIDDTPVSQTRKVLPSLKNDQPGDKKVRLWVGRIETRRTVREGWAAFESFRRSEEARARPPSPLVPNVYLAMFRKINSARSHGHQLRGSVDQPLPGDGIEIFEDSQYERDLVEVDEEPPDMEELFSRMEQAGVSANLPLAYFLVRNAAGPEQLLWLLGRLLPSQPVKPFETRDDRSISLRLGGLLRPFIFFLCYWKLLPGQSEHFSGPKIAFIGSGWKVLRHHPSIHAIYLARHIPRMDDELLTLLLRSLALRNASGVVRVPDGTPAEIQELALFLIARQLVEAHRAQLKHLSSEAIIFIYKLAYRASMHNSIAYDWATGAGKSLTVSRGALKELEWMNNEGREYLFTLLWNFVGVSPDDLTDRTVESAPKLANFLPAVLIHYLIRVLGSLRNGEDLVRIAQFIFLYRDQWDKMSQRKLITSLAYYSQLVDEPGWDEGFDSRGGNFSRRLAKILKPVGKWPSFEEVELYGSAGLAT